MLNDAAVSHFKKVYLAPGYTDLRRGIDGLASIVRFQFELDPYDKNTLFLFCGRKKSSRIKAPNKLFNPQNCKRVRPQCLSHAFFYTLRDAFNPRLLPYGH